MVPTTELERAALNAALAPLGDALAKFGLERPLSDYSRDEILTLIDVIVSAYRRHMTAEYERLAAMDRAYFDQRYCHTEVPF